MKTLTAFVGIALVVAAAPAPSLAEDEPSGGSSSAMEELAVLGELLREALGKAYILDPVYRWLDNRPFAHPHGHEAAGDAVGRPHAMYLRGYGVVLQIEAPRLREPGPAGGKASGEAPNEWDLARRRLRGEHGATAGPMTADCLLCHSAHDATGAFRAAAPAAPDRDAVRDALLGVLFRNGHKLRGLGAGERLTVAVTFREASPKVAGAHSWDADAQANALALAQVDRVDRDAGTLGPLVQDAGDARHPEELAADLHLRQGNFREAMKGYNALLERFRKESKPESALLALYGKLLQASVAAREFEKARGVLALLEEPSAQPAPEAPAATATAQLVITATREQLDDAGGDLSLAEFHRQVEVEFRGPDFTVSGGAWRPETSPGTRPVIVEGVVEAINDGDGLVVLSVGRDQKVREGERFTVSRDGQRIGEVEVIRIYDDLSGAKILSVSEDGKIRVGDRVTTNPK